MIPRVTWDALRAAVTLPDFDPAPAHRRMAPVPRSLEPPHDAPPPRPAGVLVLVVPAYDGLAVVLTRRADHLHDHSGQISFPGGSRDPEDDSLTATALRETHEELGLCDDITVIGALAPIYIPPTHFEVFPTVAIMADPPVFAPNPAEVATVLTLALDALVDDRTRRQEYRTIHGIRMQIPYYAVDGHKVWGATAIMLSELEGRLRVALDIPSPDLD